MKTNNLRRLLALVTMALMIIGSIDAKTRKGEKYLKDGKSAEDRQRWDEALELYEKAQATDPSNAAYMKTEPRLAPPHSMPASGTWLVSRRPSAMLRLAKNFVNRAS